MIFPKTTLRREAIIFEIILYIVEHKLIGRNWLGLDGVSTLGINVTKV